MKTINYKGIEIIVNDYDNEQEVKQLFDNFINSQKDYSFDSIERCYYQNGKFYIVRKENPVNDNDSDKDDTDNSKDIDIYDLVDKALEDGYTFEYADTLPTLRSNVKSWIRNYLDENKINYKLTREDIKLINSLVKDFYEDNVDDYDECYNSKKSYSLQEALKELRTTKKSLHESTNDVVTAVFKDNGFDKREFEQAYPELMSRLEFDTTEFDNRENQLAYCDIYVEGNREDVEEFIQISIWDYGCDTKEEAEELYGEGCIPTIIDESLREEIKK